MMMMKLEREMQQQQQERGAKVPWVVPNRSRIRRFLLPCKPRLGKTRTSTEETGDCWIGEGSESSGDLLPFHPRMLAPNSLLCFVWYGNLTISLSVAPSHFGRSARHCYPLRPTTTTPPHKFNVRLTTTLNPDCPLFCAFGFRW